ncbi:MAG: transglutaminase-like domain-containing protein, partial [Candidatus Marinimicrobia bacterium]|nr:transglutaminase-like domain-containing protein [Candidatus Neomarinimicrobiota bacterium]
SFWMRSDQYSTYIIGDKQGTTMNLSIIQGQDTSHSEIEVPEDLYAYTAIQPMVASKGILQGETIRVPAYDPMSNELADVTISHEGKELVKVGAEKLVLNKLRIEFKGIPSIMWLDDNGITYKEATIMGMTMERTSPELAMAKIESAEVDLLNGFAVIPSHPIYRPEQVKALTLEIEGLDADILANLESNRQTILSRDPVKLRLSPTSSPVDPKLINKHLKPSEMIQSDHDQIKEQVARILKQPKSLEETSEVLTKWVFEYLDKRPVASISGAVDILNTGVGDCTEHTTLYTALSRAAGIPTKIHIGLVYLQGRFLFHAWPVVAIQGQWVDVDPSLNQYPADVTHIAFLEGDFDNLTNLIPVLGNIEINILEQRY